MPSASEAALGFLSTAAPRPMRSADLARRAAILGVDPAATRVALGRLTRAGIVRQVERGTYAIGPAGAALDARARGWRDAEARVREWDGGWIVAAVVQLAGADRARRRRRERALRLGGFALAPNGFWARPDNLTAPLAILADELAGLGLDDDAALFGGATPRPADDATLRALWPRDALEAGYRGWIAAMAESEAGLASLGDEAAARETLLVGQAVIRAINRDPLLPDALVDTGLRVAMIDAMRRYDAAGKRCWARIG